MSSSHSSSRKCFLCSENLLSCIVSVAAAVPCTKPVSNQTITSCSALTSQDSAGLYNVLVVNGTGSVLCLYCAKLDSGWWYLFGKGGMGSAWNFAYEWKTTASLAIIDQNDISIISGVNISKIRVRTDVRFEIRTSSSVNPTSVSVRFTPSLNKATMKIPRDTGGSNTGVCIIRFPTDSTGQYDGSKVLCQATNKKCGSGNLPGNGQTTQSLFVESVYIDPQGKNGTAQAVNDQWTSNAVYWKGSYYYVYIQGTIQKGKAFLVA